MAGRWLGFSRINHQRCGWGTRVARIHRHIVTTLPHVSCRGRPRVRRWGERCGMVVFTFRLHSFISNHHPSPPLLCRACRCTVDWTDLIASRSPSEPSGAYRCCHVMSGAVHAAIYAVYDQVLSGHAATLYMIRCCQVMLLSTLYMIRCCQVMCCQVQSMLLSTLYMIGCCQVRCCHGAVRPVA